MLTYYLHSKPEEVKEYTQQLLAYLAKRSRVAEIVGTPSDADYILCSICDITEASEIAKARKYGKPIIAGGMLSELPILNELADYVWHGEAYGFFESMASGAPDGIPFISTKGKRSFQINQKIDWAINPIVQVGARSCYYYTSKGCPVKCKYCMMAYAREYQKCPENIYRAREKQIAAVKKNMMPVAAFNPYENESTRGVTEVLMKAYNKKPLKNTNMVRCGYEFVTGALSKNLAKGVTIDDFNMFLDLTREHKSKAIVYFIAGLETTDEIIEEFSKIEPDFRTTPVITLNFTYLSPQHMTPFSDYGLHNRSEIDHKEIFRHINGINKRIRVNPLAPITKSTMRAMMERTTSTEEFLALNKLMGKYANIDNESLYRSFPHLVGTSGLDEVLSRPRQKHGFFDNSYWEATQ